MEKLFVYLFFSISFYLILKKEWKFIYLIPIFNVLADISFNYFQTLSAPTFFRAFLLLVFFGYSWASFRKIGAFKSIFYFLVYTILLLLFSGEFLYSLKGVSQVVLSMSLFFVGYYFINEYSRFQLLIKNLSWIILIGVVTTATGYIFGVGEVLAYTAANDYAGGPENVGLLGSGGLYGPAIVLGLSPLILKYRLFPFKKWFFIVISFILIIFILLNVRRTAIFIPVSGILIYLLFSKSRLKTVKLLLMGAVILGISSPLYSDLLERRLKVREEAGRFAPDFYKTEDRFNENVEMIKNIYEFKEPGKVLFGIGNNIFAEHIKDGNIVRRMYHSDSAKILYGEGILGLILYFLIYVQILFKIIRIPKTGFLFEIRTGALALWFISVFVSLNGSLNLITFRAINFLLLGAFLGFAYATTRKNGNIPSLQK